MATAWILNLDAEDELRHGRVYSPSEAVRANVRAFQGGAAKAVTAPGDVVLDPERAQPGAARDCVGRAWCPTPRALALLEAAGARPEPAPAAEVLRAVNDRAFSAALGQRLPGAVFARTEEEVLAAAQEGPWLCKRAFSYAGKGQRVLQGGRVSGSDIAWVRASLEGGLGLQVEPLVDIDREFSVHGVVDREGAYALRGVIAQESGAGRAWQAAHVPRPGELAEDERAALEAEAARVAAALTAAGYFGPFGVDAFRYRDARGRGCMNARSEINARYTMGWAASGAVSAAQPAHTGPQKGPHEVPQKGRGPTT